MKSLSDRELDFRIDVTMKALNDLQAEHGPTADDNASFRRERWIALVVEAMAMDADRAELLSKIAQTPLDDLYLGHDIFTYVFRYGSIDSVLKLISRLLVRVGSRNPELRMLRGHLADGFRLHTRSVKDTYDPGEP